MVRYLLGIYYLSNSRPRLLTQPKPGMFFTMKSLYFSHDYNASDDVKMLLLRQAHGMAGIGIYWYIIERLAQAGGKLPIKIIPILSDQMKVPEAMVTEVVKDFDLFVLKSGQFSTNRLTNFLNQYATTIMKKSDGGKKGMETRWHSKKIDNNSFI